MDYDPFNREDAMIKITAELLDTWQPVACIAVRCDLSVKLTLSVLMCMRDDGKVLMARARIDGHNLVYSFKRAKYRQVLGVRVLDNSHDEEEGYVS